MEDRQTMMRRMQSHDVSKRGKRVRSWSKLMIAALLDTITILIKYSESFLV